MLYNSPTKNRHYMSVKHTRDVLLLGSKVPKVVTIAKNFLGGNICLLQFVVKPNNIALQRVA